MILSLEDKFTNSSLSQMDNNVKEVIKTLFGKEVPDIVRRIFILSIIAQNQNPIVSLRGYKQKGIENIEAYLRGVGRRSAYASYLEEDRGSYLSKVSNSSHRQATMPVVKLERPWPAVVPDWDVQDKIESEVLLGSGIEPSRFPPDVWLHKMLLDVEEKKAKRVEEKRRGWGKTRRLDPSLIEADDDADN